jgi:phosphoribosylaminoimidazole-succinocarboxamide synthase
VRDYLTGTTSTSIWSMYKKGERTVYGVTLPDGMHEHQKLPHTIITPTTKAFDGGHDEPLTPAEITERGLLTQEQWDTVSRLALGLFERGRQIAAEHGLILVDTKYEFGFDEAGNIILADEIHTPDSSRYWFAKSYESRIAAGERPESFDKDFVRTWVTARCDPYKDDIPEIPGAVVLDAAALYIDVFEIITGREFDIPDQPAPVLERIRANLKRYF